jgi:hypothetical protein
MAPSTDESLKQYSMDDVNKHNKQDDCWLIIGNMSNGACLVSMRRSGGCVSHGENEDERSVACCYKNSKRVSAPLMYVLKDIFAPRIVALFS